MDFPSINVGLYMRLNLARGLLLTSLMLMTMMSHARELRVAGTHFARIFEVAANGEYVGLGPDLLREISRKSGDTVRFSIYPWVRAQALVELGEADILIGPYKTPERELRFAFSDRAFYRDRMLFYVRTETMTPWDGNYASLHNKRVAVVRGWAYGHSFDHARNMMQIENVQKLESGLLMLLHDRVELLATNYRNTEELLPRMDMTGKIHSILPLIDVQDGYFAFPKTPEYDGLRAKFNEIFNGMVTRGELARLARKHNVHLP